MKRVKNNKRELLVISIVIILSILIFHNFQGYVISPLDPFSNTTELHWNHMPLTYNTKNCDAHFNGNYLKDISNALKYIENKTNNSITFKRIYIGQADITYNCQIDNSKLRFSPPTKEIPYKTIINAEAIQYVYKNNPNILSRGEINVYSTKKCLGQKPVVLIHETLHLFNLKHTPKDSAYTNDIMHPENTNCYADISQTDIDYLRNIYRR